MGMMTVTEAEDAIVGGSRIVKYDPTDTGRGDPMKYGAYRRWKLAEGELGNAGAKGRPKSLRQKSQKAQGGKPTSAQDKNKKGKGKGSLNADSFYNAIKKLGSGPASKVTLILRYRIIYFNRSVRLVFLKNEFTSLDTCTIIIESLHLLH
jgi:hypothetical protein